VLIDAVNAYLALRQSLGFSYHRNGYRLRSFARFAAARGDDHVRSQTAIAWARSTPAAQERNRRLRVVVRFARYLHAEDPRHEVPPEDLFPSRRHRPVPYIFAPEQVQRLVAAALLLKPQGSLGGLVMSTLIALLAATGLRVGEALALRLSDLTADGLLVRQSKFRKSRLVPLHPTAQAGLERYLERRLAVPADTDHLFINRHGHALRRRSAGNAFRELVGKPGLRPASQHPKPILPSLRHTFAVRALESCPHDRDAVGRHLLALTTYMGHASVAETYWYLQTTPELLTDIVRACEAYLKEVTP
jgi:site-specific recombinase XerD